VGRRSEQRIALRVPILVCGKDSRGTPFTITAQTHDINATGASLNGLKGIADVGSKIEIEYQGRKAMYRVQWIGQVGTPRSGHAGVKCLEPGNYIWGVPLTEWTPDTYDPDSPEPQKHAIVPTIESLTNPPPNIERRRFPGNAGAAPGQFLCRAHAGHFPGSDSRAWKSGRRTGRHGNGNRVYRS
jgi:hypothetical protein